MFVVEIPEIPTERAQLVLAQTDAENIRRNSQSSLRPTRAIATKINKYAGVFGACSLLDTTITSSKPDSAWHKIYPDQAVARYLHKKSDVGFDYKVRLITPPSRGSIRDYSQNPYTHKDGFIDNTS